MAKEKSTTKDKPTGVNKGIKEGMSPEEFKGRVICKKCGKDIEFTLESELHQRCPRCNGKIERNLENETKEAKKIIKFDILRRSKRYLLHFAFILSACAIAYNLVGFFCEWFYTRFWLALMSLPVIILSVLCTRITRIKSASKTYRFFAWLMIGVNVIALALMVISAVPELSDNLHQNYEWLRNNVKI